MSTLAESSTLAADYKRVIDEGGTWVRHSVAKEIYEACEHMHEVVLHQRDQIEQLRQQNLDNLKVLGEVAIERDRLRKEMQKAVAELESAGYDPKGLKIALTGAT